VRLLCEDEARFRRISDARRCWTPAGGRSEVSGQRVREYEYAFAAVSPQDGALDTLVLPAVNTEAMSIFWAEVSQRHANELLIVVRDGAGGLVQGSQCRIEGTVRVKKAGTALVDAATYQKLG
jgi:hypothetical protein